MYRIILTPSNFPTYNFLLDGSEGWDWEASFNTILMHFWQKKHSCVFSNFLTFKSSNKNKILVILQELVIPFSLQHLKALILMQKGHNILLDIIKILKLSSL